MEIQDIRAIAVIMRDTGLTSLEYSENGAVLKISRGDGNPIEYTAAGKTPDGSASEVAGPSDSCYVVSSPMVGVFYAAPGEDLEPYVVVGDAVKPGDVLCVIEAMKMMNEITAERGGTISEVCVSNKQVVDFGAPLFKIMG